jgi:hypothetical protein
MRTYLLACAAAVVLAAAGPRASAWCHFELHICCNHGCDCPPCDDCCYDNPDVPYCGWPGYHLDGCGGDAYAGVDYGYPTAGYAAPAGGNTAPAGSSPSFPPPPTPVDGGSRSSSYGYPGYGYDPAGYAGYGSSYGGTGYGSQVPSYWYGR